MKVILAPIGSAGDVYPYLGLGRALQDRGHSITLLGGEYFQGAVERLGFRFSALTTHDEFMATVGDPQLWHPFHGSRYVMRLGVDYIARLYEAISRESDRDSVVLTSCLGWGARIAEELGRARLITVHLQPSVLFSTEDPPALPGIVRSRWVPRWWNRAIYRMGERWVLEPACLQPLNAFRASLGLHRPIRGLTTWWQSPRQVLGLFPSWFAASQSDWPPQVALTQFPLWDEGSDTELSPALEEFLAAGDPPLVFTPGSANQFGAEFFQSAVATCASLSRRGILVSRFAEHLPSRMPPGVLHISQASFARLLPRAAAIVHHGGIGTTARAMASGIPQIIQPFSHDQPDNAMRITRLGVGCGIPATRHTVEAWCRGIERMLGDPALHARCRDVAARIAETDPFAESCDVIERFAAT